MAARLAVLLSLGLALACSSSGDGDRADAGDCGDLLDDPLNCGACGRTCVIPNAVAGCDDGDCVVDSCESGFADGDGDANNGCELESQCVGGADCDTACGSTGTSVCAGGLLDACEIPNEVCNGIDDDCNDACDEGAMSGCRAGVHRAVSTRHLYTSDLTAAMTTPYTLEFENYFYLYADEVAGTQPVYLCENVNGRPRLSASSSCDGDGTVALTLGHWALDEECGSVPLYGLFGGSDHFYTIDAAERDDAVANLGYVFEGIIGHVWTAP